MQLKLKLVLIFAVLKQSIFAAQGAQVTCSGNQGQACNTACPNAPGGCTWNISTTLTNCQIKECSFCPSFTQNTSDQFCSSCAPTTPFTNFKNTACVESTYSCINRLNNPWSDLDCTLCYGKTMYANTATTSCVSSTGSCISRANTLWNDNDCTACNGKVLYSNISGSSCVESANSCVKRENILWTDADCKICNGKDMYANSSQTKCVATSASCLSRGGTAWTSDDCNLCDASKSKLMDGQCTQKSNVLLISLIVLVFLLI